MEDFFFDECETFYEEFGREPNIQECDRLMESTVDRMIDMADLYRSQDRDNELFERS